MSRHELKTDSKSANQSSDRLLELVELLCEQPEPMRISDIASASGISISTVYRFLASLQKRGYAVQDSDTGRYSLTFKFCRIGDSIRSRTDTRTLSMNYLHNISQEFGFPASLEIEYDMSIMTLETVGAPLLSSSSMGGLHCTGAGKLFLAGYNARKLEQFIAVKGLPPCTPVTITELSQLRKELLKVRMRGFAYDNGESVAEMRCISAPIKDYTNQVIATISVRGPCSLMSDEYIQERLPVLLSSAAKISIRMGYEPAKDNTPSYRR